MTKIRVQLKSVLKGHQSAIFDLQWIAGESYLLSASGDGSIVRWTADNILDGVAIAKANTSIYAMMLDQNKQLWFGDMHGDLYKISLTERIPRKMQLHRDGIFDFVLHRGLIYAAGGDGRISVWNKEFELVDLFRISQSSIRCMAYCQPLNLLLAGCSDSNIYVLSLPTLKVVHVLEKAHQPSVFSLAFWNGQPIFFSGGRDATIKKWFIEKDWYCETLEQAAHWYTVNDLSIRPDQRIFASASRDKTIKLWDCHTFSLLKVIDQRGLDAHRNSVNKVIWVDNETLISASDDHSIRVWQIQTVN